MKLSQRIKSTIKYSIGLSIITTALILLARDCYNVNQKQKYNEFYVNQKTSLLEKTLE